MRRSQRLPAALLGFASMAAFGVQAQEKRPPEIPEAVVIHAFCGSRFESFCAKSHQPLKPERITAASASCKPEAK
jgi:hypothetical protein